MKINKLLYAGAALTLVIEEQDRVIGFDLPHPASFTGFGCVIEVRRDIAGTVLECQFQLVASPLP